MPILNTNKNGISKIYNVEVKLKKASKVKEGYQSNNYEELMDILAYNQDVCIDIVRSDNEEYYSSGLNRKCISTVEAKNLYNKYGLDLAQRDKQLEGGLFLRLAPGISYDSRDSVINPRNGSLVSARYEEAFGLDGFSKTNGRLLGMAKKFIPIAKKSSLTFTGRGGMKVHGSDMPEIMAFRLGGPYTIRGYKVNGVGTGTSFIMGSAELATPIPFVDRLKVNFLQNLRMTFWVDAGKVFNPTISSTLYDRPLQAITAGVGLKINIPGVGPLSVDYGFPLTNPGLTALVTVTSHLVLAT